MSDLIQVHILKDGKRIHWAQTAISKLKPEPIKAFAMETFAKGVEPLVGNVTIEILNDEAPNFIQPSDQGPAADEPK